MGKATTTKALTLAEAEQRLQRALTRLVAAAKAKGGSAAAVEKLTLEKSELEARFKGLKGDYDALERTLGELKAGFKELKGAAREKDLAGEAPMGAAHSSSAEVGFLKKELERVHKEYKTLDNSFRLLRDQYAELQEAAGSGEDKKQPSEMTELKGDLSARLDKTISALEKLVG
jgi:chromosome segregation ATPase